MTARLMTPFREEKIKREERMLREYRELLERPGQSKTMAQRYLMEKYRIQSVSTFYAILKRWDFKEEEN